MMAEPMMARAKADVVMKPERNASIGGFSCGIGWRYWRRF
jgi:hypothetical protein